MAELMATVAKLVNEPGERGRASAVLSMRIYCWPHRTAHTLDVGDVEVLVYTLGAMVVDGYKLGNDEHRHAPDCPLEVIRLGNHPEGYCEHTEQGIICRGAEPVNAGEQQALLQAARAEHRPVDGPLLPARAAALSEAACPECRSGKHANCTGEVRADTPDGEGFVPCPCSVCAQDHRGPVCPVCHFTAALCRGHEPAPAGTATAPPDQSLRPATDWRSGWSATQPDREFSNPEPNW